MKNHYTVVFIVILAAVVASFYFDMFSETRSEEGMAAYTITKEATLDVTIRTSGEARTFSARIADTPSERERGLMGIEALVPNEAMLFVFDSEEEQAFWMKDTQIPLDIVFIGADRRVNGIQHAVPCTADPCPIYSGTAQYVLEVAPKPQNNINAGDMALFELP